MGDGADSKEDWSSVRKKYEYLLNAKPTVSITEAAAVGYKHYHESYSASVFYLLKFSLAPFCL